MASVVGRKGGGYWRGAGHKADGDVGESELNDFALPELLWRNGTMGFMML